MNSNQGIGAIIVVFLIAIAGYYAWPYFTKSPVTNYPSQGTDVIVFGDSLAAGYGTSDGKTLASLLSNKLDLKAPNEVINFGKNGDTTESALKRMRVFDGYKPNVVVLLIGGNDYLQRLPMDKAFENIAKIIEGLQARGAVVVLVGIRLNPIIGNFDSQFEELHKKYNTAYVPNVLDGVFGNQELMYDTIHPNDAGYKIVSTRIAGVVKDLLK